MYANKTLHPHCKGSALILKRKRKNPFSFGLHSPYTTLLRQVRQRLGNPKKKHVFSLDYTRLALLCFAKLGSGSAIQRKKAFFLWTTLALH